ncbi:MAG: hypothetical protein ACKO96_19890, partial [Flammeovirgaceae bacterium]
WAWVDSFGNYEHDCTEDNHKGKLKKYWQPSTISFEEKLASAVGTMALDSEVSHDQDSRGT